MLHRIFSCVVAPSSTDLPLISSSSSAAALEVKHGRSRGLRSHFQKQSSSAGEAACPCTCGESVNAVNESHLQSAHYTFHENEHVGLITLLWRILHCCVGFVFLSMYLLKIYIERNFFWRTSGSSVLGCCLCLWKSHFSKLTALHFATSASASLILSWPRWLIMNVLSKQSEAKLPLRWVRGENLGKGNEHPKYKEIIIFSFSTIRFPGWWGL